MGYAAYAGAKRLQNPAKMPKIILISANALIIEHENGDIPIGGISQARESEKWRE